MNILHFCKIINFVLSTETQLSLATQLGDRTTNTGSLCSLPVQIGLATYHCENKCISFLQMIKLIHVRQIKLRTPMYLHVN